MENSDCGENARYWLFFIGGKVLLFHNAQGGHSVPLSPVPPCPAKGMLHAVGEVNGVPCLAAVTEHPPSGPGWEAVSIWSSYTLVAPDFHDCIGRGVQMIHWDEHTRYCPCCGTSCVPDTSLSKRCPGCGELLFPHIALAILALVHRDDSILLVHAHNFRGPHYSCIAGYVEPGETLEQCVRREVLEETNLVVDEVTYFASQPWPFPSLLMAAYTARYKEGDLRLQESELSSGAFFTRDALPPLPPPFTLSRRLIDAWARQ